MIAPPAATITPWTDPAVIIAALGVLAAVVGCGAYWTWRTTRLKAPIDAEAAEAAAAEKLGNLALAIAQDARAEAAAAGAEVRVLRAELTTERAHSRTQDGRIHLLTIGLRTLRDAWQELIDEWPTVRLKEDPPKMPQINIDLGPRGE